MKFIALFILFFSLSVSAESFQSGSNRTALIELYSSQGCSSCPPAERWVSNLLKHDKLWVDFIPLVFHVDYWNQLGWRDPFSNPAYSQRQRAYHQQGSIKSVYTPGFVLDGGEWRSWFLRRSVPLSEKITGALSVTISKNHITASYDSKLPLVLNIALLGFGLETDVKSGENQGRSFNENFIVLSTQAATSTNGTWDMDLIKPQAVKAKRYALAAWVSTTNNLKPLQATGGWLDTGNKIK